MLTILLGDRVGVTLNRVAPLGAARSTSPITIQFSEPMDRASASSSLVIDPPLEGNVTWSGSTMVYTPTTAMEPGASYTVTLQQGALSQSGREVLSNYEFAFQVRRPRVAYLYPADDVPQNIWVVDPNDPDSAAQVTFSPSGIYDFAVSPDGSRIAFSERNTNGTNELKMIDLDTGALTQLTNCADSSCTTPVWRPDGTQIAYERIDFNSELEGVGQSPTRIWLVDLLAVPATTRPLINQSQVLGYNAQWSADGRKIAMFDSASVSILVYTPAEELFISVPSRAGTSGALSPDGTRLIFPEVPPISEGGSVQQYLRVVNLVENTADFISTPDDPVEDDQVRWSPDGEHIVVARRYTDERYTRGHQLVMIDPDNPGDVQPLTDDPAYANGVFHFDPNGDQLVIQRLRVLNEDNQPDNLARP
jgi:Tol biopolymer transport system component